MEGLRERSGSGIHRSLAGALATVQLRRRQVGLGGVGHRRVGVFRRPRGLRV
jgi:hypothetical protein